MLSAYNQFLINLRTTRESEALYLHLVQVQRLPNDLTDLLRLEIIYAVSALDTCIHDFTRIGMLQSYLGTRVRTDSFKNFKMSVDAFFQIQNYVPPFSPPAEYYFEQELRRQHNHLAFQEPAKIAEALSLFWLEPHKWQKIAIQMSMNEDDAKKKMKLICSKRNQIVHEFDIDPLSQTRRTIIPSDAKDAVDFIEKLGTAIFNLVR